MAKWVCVLIILGLSGVAACSNPPPDVVINITPTSASVALSQTQQFMATVTGTSNTVVTWQIACTAGGSACGSISTSGLYTAPATIPNPPTVTVSAISKANPLKSASATVTVVSNNASIAVVPATVTLGPGQAVTFTANVIPTSGAVTWAATCSAGGSACGTITPTGVTPPAARYVAPTGVSTQTTVTITATLQSNTSVQGTATVTITGNTSGISIVVNPQSPTVQTYATTPFTAVVTGTTNVNVTWQVSCSAGGTNGPACGAISSTGTDTATYTAPNSVPTTQDGSGGAVTDVVTVTAISQANSAATGSAIVTVTTLNQQKQSIPVSLGSSGSNANALCTSPAPGFCFGGTLGSLISREGQQYILSNNHVLGMTDTATAGQSVTQPGLIDSGCSLPGTTTVANFTEYITLNPPPATPVDVAIAQVVSGNVDAPGKILELGATCNNGGSCTTAGVIPDPGSPATGNGMPATPNESVAKSGRSTGLTCASVEAVATNVEISYSPGCSTTSFTVIYSDAVMVGQTATGDSFSAEGDSGSLIVDQATAQPVALLFAGDSTSSVGNPVADVLNALQSGSNAATFVGGSPHAVNACMLPQPTSVQAPLPSIVSAAVPTSSSVSAQAIQKATTVRDTHSVELLANPGVAAVGVGASLDSPNDAAVMVFVQRGVTRNPIPAEIDGVRTRIIERDTFPVRGSLSHAESQQLAAQSPTAPVPSSLVRSAIATKQKNAAQLMTDPAIQGVGVGASLDSPGDPAIMIYVLKGKPHNPIPITIDGIRTRVKETNGFRAGFGRTAIGKGCQGAPASANSASAAKKVIANPY